MGAVVTSLIGYKKSSKSKNNKEEEEILSFGKYKGVTLKEIWRDNPGYFSWIQNADFPLYTKNVMKNFADRIRLENKFNS